MGCCGGHGHGSHHPATGANPHSARHEDPLTILKQRLARGEITVEEYERIRAILERDRAGTSARSPERSHQHGAG